MVETQKSDEASGVVLLGVNHLTAPVALRERLYVSGGARDPFLVGLLERSGVDEALLLCTCNRTEVYLAGGTRDDAFAALAEQAGLPVAVLAPHLYDAREADAAAHLFRVACGLDSLMIGEAQILGQVREAAEAACTCGTLGPVLTRLVQHAVTVGKRARTATAIGDGAFSIGRAAVEFARRLFPDLGASPVLVLGAGTMSELTARHLCAGGVSTILVANRTFAHACALAERLGGRAIRYEGMGTALTEVDIVISATSAPHYVLHHAELAAVMARRDGRPLCLIDIAMPRDIEPRVATLAGVHLYNVDDLRAVAEDDRQRREAEVPRVEALIDEEVARWTAWHEGRRAAPVIAALRDAMEEIRREELLRAAPWLATLTAEQRAAVEGLTALIVNKMLHTPTVRLKDVAAHPERLPLVCDLFALAGEERRACDVSGTGHRQKRFARDR